MRFLPALILACCFAIPALAEDTPVLFVQNVVSGDEITLNDGRTVRLEGVKGPLVSTPDLGAKAIKVLHQLTEGHTLILSHTASSRYSGITAQVDIVQKDGSKTWLQGEMLKSGFVFVYPPTGSEDRLPDMLKAESTARKAKNGIWGNYLYADLKDHDAATRYGHFAFVTGKITDAKRVKDKVYLNFGDDWRKDFAISIAARDLKIFRAANIDPLEFYPGKTVRVRGWIKRDYGPMITVTHPAQIEILDKN